MRNKKLNNQSGFTLVEIIIVVVILGVLASLVLPRVVGQIGRARSAEAVNEMGPVFRAVDACMQGRPMATGALATTSVAACDSFAEIGVTAPVPLNAATPGPASFSYVWTTASPAGAGAPAAGSVTITLTATLVPQAGGAAAAPFDTIAFTYDALTGAIPAANKATNGIFGGLNLQ